MRTVLVYAARPFMRPGSLMSPDQPSFSNMRLNFLSNRQSLVTTPGTPWVDDRSVGSAKARGGGARLRRGVAAHTRSAG